MTALSHDAAVAFVDALKREATGQPERPVDYELAPALLLRVVYAPPKRNGRIDTRDVTMHEEMWRWSLWTTAWYRQAPPHADEQVKGWRGINRDEALAFLEGQTVAEYEAKIEAQTDEAFDVFARIARNHA